MSENSFFEAVTNHYINELPFVVYCKPFSFDIVGLLQKDDNLYKINDFAESGFVFSPFDFRKDSVLIPFSKSQQLKLSDELNTDGLTDQVFPSGETDKEHYFGLIKKALRGIETNEFQKLVVSRNELIDIAEIDIVRTLKKLLIRYNSAFVYCWYHPKVGLWFGATPESLLKIDGLSFKTMALAGTQTYDGTLEVNWTDKEKNEQQIVTEYIKEVIAPFVTDIEISEPISVKAGELIHLKTDISAKLPNEPKVLNKLILKLHPTPAVCGSPKLEAIQFIIDHENYNREFYTGFLGELNKEAKIDERLEQGQTDEQLENNPKTSTDLYVNLRCMQLKDNKAHIYAGAGITQASDPQLEWEETVHKAKTIKAVIAF